MSSYKKMTLLGNFLNIGLIVIFIVGMYAYCLMDGAELFLERFIALTITCLVLYVIATIITSQIKYLSARKAISIIRNKCDPCLYLKRTEDVPNMKKNIDINLVDIQYYKVLAFAFSDRNKEARDALSEIIVWYYKWGDKREGAYMLKKISLASNILEDEALFEEYYTLLGNVLEKTSKKI